MINAGKRHKALTAEQEREALDLLFKNEDPRPMRKGLVRCAKCDRVYASRRATPHEDGPECQAQQITNAYESKGWRQVFNVTQGKMLEAAGVPVEWALAGVHVEESPTRFDEFGRVDRDKPKAVHVQHKVAFAPLSAIRCVNLFVRVKLTPAMRHRALRVLWNRPESLDAIDSTKRLGGRAMSAIHQLTVAAEQEDGVDPLEYADDAQVPEEGDEDGEF